MAGVSLEDHFDFGSYHGQVSLDLCKTFFFSN